MGFLGLGFRVYGLVFRVWGLGLPPDIRLSAAVRLFLCVPPPWEIACTVRPLPSQILALTFRSFQPFKLILFRSVAEPQTLKPKQTQPPILTAYESLALISIFFSLLSPRNENGSNQGQNLALTGLFVPNSRGGGARSTAGGGQPPWWIEGCIGPLSVEFDTHKTVEARLWPWLSGSSLFSSSSCSLFVRKR